MYCYKEIKAHKLINHCHSLLLLLMLILLGCGDSTSVVNGSKKDNEVILRDYALSEDEIWDPENIYIVHGILQIPTDKVLEILPGTEVKFANNAQVKVRGILKIGTSLFQETLDEAVLLTSINENPEQGNWNGILFDFTHGADSYLRGVVIEFAKIGLDIKTTSPTVIDCTLRHNETAIALDGSDSIIQHNAIIENDIGIRTIERQNRPQIEKNNITNNNTGIFCENVQTIIQENNLANNNRSVWLNVKFNFEMSNNWWGTVVNEEIDKVIIDSNDTNIITKTIGTVIYEPISVTRYVDAGPRE